MLLRRYSAIILLLFITATLIGCDQLVSNDEDGLTGDLATTIHGTWSASMFQFINTDDPLLIYDLIHWGGVFVVNVDTAATSSLLSVWPGDPSPSSIELVTVTLNETNLTITTSDSVLSLDYQVDEEDENMITLEGRIDAAFDWDGNGTKDPADMMIVLDRGDDVPISQLAGTWTRTATTAIDLEGGGSAQDLDLSLGEVLDIDPSGAFARIGVTRWDSTDAVTGTMSTFGRAIIISDTGEEPTRADRVSWDGVQLIFYRQRILDIDFDGLLEPYLLETTYAAFNGPALADLAGAWRGNSHDVEAVGGTPSISRISGGGSYALELEAAGNYQIINTFPGEEDELSEGTVTMLGPLFEFTDLASGESSFTFLDFWETDYIEIYNTCDQADLDGDGSDEVVSDWIKLDRITEIELTALAGTWNATSMRFVEVGGAGSWDHVGEGGGCTLTVAGDGTFSMDVMYPDETIESDSGTISIVADMLKMYSSVTMETDAVHCQVTGAATLELRNNNDWHDFGGDGTEERCFMILELVKQ